MGSTPHSSSQSRKSKMRYTLVPIVILIALLILFLPIIPISYTEKVPHEVAQATTTPTLRIETYIEKEPYQSTQTRTQVLINDKPTVRAGYYLYYRIYIDVSGKSGNIVYGRVTETAGYDIEFYVFDQKNFNAWINNQPATPYVASGRIQSYSFSFVPDHSDYYFFVLNNRYSLFTNKVPYIYAEWRWQETVTDYRDVTKTRTVIDYITITRTTTEYIEQIKTRYVSIFQLLLKIG